MPQPRPPAPDPGTPIPPPARSSGKARTVVAAVAVAAASVAVVGYSQHSLAPASVPVDSQPDTLEQRSGRLLPQVPVPPGRGGYTFTHTRDSGRPVTFDPCRPVRYVINPDGGPAGSVRLIRSAVGDLSAATGLKFVYGGTTSEPAAADRNPVQQRRYGSGWAPVLIGWSDAAREPALRGRVAGLGGSTRISGDEVVVRYVTGRVVLDGEQLRQAPRRYTRAVVLHELGHVVGLTHTPDAGQLMHSETVAGVTDFADGDLRGLAHVGAGSCLPRD